MTRKDFLRLVNYLNETWGGGLTTAERRTFADVYYSDYRAMRDGYGGGTCLNDVLMRLADDVADGLTPSDITIMFYDMRGGMMRDDAESIAYTIFKTVTRGADVDSDYIQTIADDVELYGHVETLRIWMEANA